MKKTNTFIIPVVNNYEGLLGLLESLEKHTPDNYDVIVINNGYYLKDTLGQEDIDRIAKAKLMSNIWIDPYRNLGFGKAMNTGIKLATTEFVTLSNDDVEVLYPTWWDELMALFEADEKLGSWNPHSICNKTAQGDRVCQYEIKKEYTAEDIVEMKKIFHAEREYSGGCTFFTICRKKMFDDVGLYDESFGLGSGEDYDLCVRASRAGWKMKGGSRVMVLHWWGKTKDNMPVDPDGKATSNYDMIAGGNQHMERKWGPHQDKDPNGWSVSGRGGPDIPLDSETGIYKEKDKWFQEVPL